MSVLAGLAALLIAAGSIPAGASWVPGEHGGPTVRMSIVNWGSDVEFAGPRSSARAEVPATAVWAHLGANGPTTRITVRIDPGREGLHGYYGRFSAPDAFGGPIVRYCGDEYRHIESYVVCGFDVPMSSGLNHLTFDLQSASFDGIRSTRGVVIGATLQMTPVLEARGADGTWRTIPAGGTVEVSGGLSSALRYRLMNMGDIPFRAPNSCRGDSIVWPGQQLLCAVRSPRPGFALVGDYDVAILLEDPAGGGASAVLRGTVEVPW